MQERPELERKILEDLAKTGYPVEIRACMMLQADGWSVTHNPVYLDIEERKGREIDLRAIRGWWTQRSKPPAHFVLCELFVECKKSDKPWVFFVTPVLEAEPTLNCIRFSSGIENLLWPRGEEEQQVVDWDFLRSSHMYFSAETRARTYYEAFKGQEKGERSPAIFSALSVATKALLHHSSQLKQTMDDVDVSSMLTFFWYPVVLFNGPLYEATVPLTGDISLAPSSHVQVDFSYIAASADPSAQGERFLVDIVHESYLPHYLARHTAFHEGLVSRVDACYEQGTVQTRRKRKESGSAAKQGRGSEG
jgi:hypothetical protein